MFKDDLRKRKCSLLNKADKYYSDQLDKEEAEWCRQKAIQYVNCLMDINNGNEAKNFIMLRAMHWYVSSLLKSRMVKLILGGVLNDCLGR